jgi:glycosyltransferase involved in cell wall biosynthesis
MLSLLETVEKLRRNEIVGEAEIRSLQNSANAAERFLAHTALSLISMQSSREHLSDALRAIDYADRTILQTFIDLSKLSKVTDDVPLVTVKFGLAMIERKLWAVAFDAFSQAIRFDLEHDCELFADVSIWASLSEAFEAASRTLGRSVHSAMTLDGPVRIGLLTSSLVDDSPTEQLISGWLRYANPELASLRVYCTEALSKSQRHQLQLSPAALPSSRSGVRILADLKARRNDPWLAPVDADAVQTSRILTERLVRDQIELLLVDSTIGDAPIGMTLAGRPVPRQIAIDRGYPFPTSGLDEVIQVNSRLQRDENPLWEKLGVRTRTVFQGIDTSTTSAAVRRDYGLSDDAVVLVTHCDAQSDTLSIAFVKMIARLLGENPRAVFLIVGEVRESDVRSVFDAAGVTKRVGFAGKVKSPASLIAMADLYVANFPTGSRDGVLKAMSAGKPVMILAGDYDLACNAQFVGAPYAIVGSPATMLDRCSAMLRDKELREGVGSILKRRALEKFGISNTIDSFMRLAGEVQSQRLKNSAPLSMPLGQKWAA